MNKLARSITEWTKACDKRLSCLISYIHDTCDYKQYCHVGNTAKQCRLGLFQDSDFAGDLEESNSTSGGTLCIFGSHTFVPISWMCKKQTSLSHSPTESEIISLDAGLRMDGKPALDFWDLIVTVLPGNTHQNDQVRGEPCKSPTRKKKHGKIDDLNNVDFVSSNANSCRKCGQNTLTARFSRLVVVRIRMELEVSSHFFYFAQLPLFLLRLVSFTVGSDPL